MSSTRHTGVIVSAKDADAWHAEIKQIMAEESVNFGEAVDLYIAGRSVQQVVDQSGWDAA